MDFSEVKSIFGFHVRLQNPESRFQNLNPDFPIKRNLNDQCPIQKYYSCDFSKRRLILRKQNINLHQAYVSLLPFHDYKI